VTVAILFIPGFVFGKDEGKGHPGVGHKGPEGEWGYSSTLSLTSALDGVGGQRHAPAAVLSGIIIIIIIIIIAIELSFDDSSP